MNAVQILAIMGAYNGFYRAELAKAGKLIGAYDQIIAAHARSQGPIIVTTMCVSLSECQAPESRTGTTLACKVVPAYNAITCPER